MKAHLQAKRPRWQSRKTSRAGRSFSDRRVLDSERKPWLGPVPASVRPYRTNRPAVQRSTLVTGNAGNRLLLASSDFLTDRKRDFQQENLRILQTSKRSQPKIR